MVKNTFTDPATNKVQGYMCKTITKLVDLTTKKIIFNKKKKLFKEPNQPRKYIERLTPFGVYDDNLKGIYNLSHNAKRPNLNLHRFG